MVNDLHMDYEIKTKGSKEYIEITTNGMKYTTTRGYFTLGNLFGGDERLGKKNTISTGPSGVLFLTLAQW